MIPQDKLDEVRSYLEKSENPLFFFDDDCDGLCSYLLLKRLINRGKGIVVKGAPFLELRYERKVNELSPDYVFVLDKTDIEQEFIDKVNVPIFWIDHHPVVKRKGVHYYNPLLYTKDDSRPVTYWCYKIAKRDLWIATVGCVSDHYIPSFIDDFCKQYPKLLDEKKDIFEILYNSRLGLLVKTLNFCLKGKMDDVKKSISILLKIEDPEEILNKETPRGAFLYRRFEKIRREYELLFKEALNVDTKEKLVCFIYTSKKSSFTAELSTELVYKFPDKVILVGREKSDYVKMSIRSRSVPIRDKIKNALEGVDGYGGGHLYACGANIAKKDLSKFLNNLRSQLT